MAAIDEDGARTRALRIADLGTGSGALLVALLTELPSAAGIGTDISCEALAAARDNAGRLGLGRRAAFAACDFGAALAGGFDLVVSNPPISPAATSPGFRPRSAMIPAVRSMAAPTASPAIAPLRDRRLNCSSPAAIWWSNSASVRNRTLRNCSARPVSRPRPRATIFQAFRVRFMRVLPQCRHDP